MKLLETLLVLKKGVMVKDDGFSQRFGEYPKNTLVQAIPPVSEGGSFFLYVPGGYVRPVEISLDAEIEKMFSVSETPLEYIPAVKQIPILGSRIENSIAA